MTLNSDNQLVANYLKGDEKSLEVLIRRYLGPIYGFVFRFTGNIYDAEDITQEIFVKVWRNLKKFDQQKSFKTWIFSIAKNTAIDFLRKRRTQVFSETEIETVVDPAPLPQELLEKAEAGKLLESVLNKLELKYRMVLLLYYNDHFNFREIAEILGEPLNTIKSRHRRALLMLRKLLEK
jgi:RNA polymerase sigma-70 factor (ECF subfamily)